MLARQLVQLEHFCRRERLFSQYGQPEVCPNVAGPGQAGDLDLLAEFEPYFKIICIEVARVLAIVQIQLVPAGIVTNYHPFQTHWFGIAHRLKMNQLRQRSDLISRPGPEQKGGYKEKRERQAASHLAVQVQVHKPKDVELELADLVAEA